ncbi:hypothetical protein FRB90_008719, partial [Tulasnella sp. 427]
MHVDRESRVTDNLLPDIKYVTTWNFGGMTNEVMVWMNLIRLGMISDRIPILYPIVGLELHFGTGVETISAGGFFDLPRLSKAIGHPVLDWADVKRGRYDRPWNPIDRAWHDDDEMLGCWSIYQTFDESRIPIDREGGPLVVHVDARYTGVPESVRLNGTTTGWDTSFNSLTHLMSPEGRSEALSQQPPLPTYSRANRPLSDGVAFPQPDDHLACFDCLYWVWTKQYWEWEQAPSPTWEAVGKHLHFTREADEIADIYLRQLFGVAHDAPIPPFITVHIRHGDFKRQCPDVANTKSCFAPLSEYDRHIQDIVHDLAEKHGPESTLGKVKEVIVMSDETDPEWWADVHRMGWKSMREFEQVISRDHGMRWPAIVDSIVQSRGAGFVGTSRSTMSIIAAWRVIDWNDGPWRL